MKLKAWLLAAAAALLMLGFALEPVVSLASAREGLNLFLSVVLPSLLPFMVAAGLFVESGAASAAGRVLTRFMRPVFACPGEAAFALTAGLLSGYPTGARLALDMHEKGLINADDAARTGLLASSCGPVFILGAAGAGLLGSPQAGWLIALSHYTAVIMTGLIFSIGGDRRVRAAVGAPAASGGATVMAALGTAIKNTVETLWAVGGYIVLFSVVAGLLRHYNALYPASAVLSPVLKLLGLNPLLAEPLLIGSIEMTNGCGAVARTGASLADKCAAIAALVSFGGLCIQSQSMLFLSGVRLSAWKFALMKTVQAAAAFLLCRAFGALPAFSSTLAVASGAAALSPASALLSSAVYAAGLLLPFTALAAFSGRASTRGSA